MDQPNLPRHIVERVERRWAAVLSHQATLRPERDSVATKDPTPDPAKPARDNETAQRMSKRPVRTGSS
jgi:hypothetical protein